MKCQRYDTEYATACQCVWQFYLLLFCINAAERKSLKSMWLTEFFALAATHI